MAADGLADELATVDDSLRSAETATEGLESGLRDVEQAAERAARETRDIDDAASSSATSFTQLGTSLRGVLGAAGLAVGLQETIRFLGNAVTAATDLSESVNAVQVIFGEASDKILAFGEDTSDAVFLAASEFNSLATVTGNLLQGFGLGVDEAADITIELTERAADLASVFNTDVSEALEAINAALRGETEQIRRFTGSFSIEEVKAFGRELFNTTDALTSQQQVLSAVELILSRTAAVQGDAANTADELANQQRALNEQWVNAQATIGTALIPAVESAIPILLDLIDVSVDLAPAIVLLVDALAEGVSVVAEFAEPVLDLVTGLVSLADTLGDVEVGGVSLGDAFGFARDRSVDFVRTGLLAPVTVGNAVIDFFSNLGDSTFDLGAQLEALNRITPETAFNFADYADAITLSTSATEDAATITRDLFIAYGDVAAAGTDAATASDLINASIEAQLGSFQALQEEVAGLPEAIQAVGSVAGLTASQVAELGGPFVEAAEAARDFRLATLELADPVFAAARAQERLTAANEALADLGPEATAQDIANAQLDIASAALEADAALRGLGNINIVGGPFDRSVSIIAEALGTTRQEVLDLLEDAQILDQTVIGPQVEFLVDDDELETILSEIPDEVTVGIRWNADNFPSVPQTPGAADQIDSRTGGGTFLTGSTGGTTVIINNPTDNDIAGNAAQAGNIIAGVTNSVTAFSGR